MDKDLLKKVESHIHEIFKEKADSKFVYHNITHSQNVAEMVVKIAKQESLDQEEVEILKIAAWFHDVGYFDSPEDHENQSSKEAESFLSKNNYPQSKIEKVKECILATKMPHSPKSKLEEVICDADLHHLGAKDFEDKNELYRIEAERTSGEIFTEIEWLQNTIDFLTEHKFYTRYALENFEEQKIENLVDIQKKLRKQKSKIKKNELKEKKIKVDKEKVAVKKSKSTEAGRGVETMFRNVMRTHVEFSALADNKANIMISVNTLLLTAIIAILAKELNVNTHLIIPTIILTTVSLVTIIYATLVTRPKVTEGTFSTNDIKQKKANLLFFGNFYRMNLDDFEWGMKELISDTDYLYDSMIKDFYHLGNVLGQKYRYLRICYTIFMIGLIVSVLAFAVAIFFNPTPTNLGPIIQ